MGYTLATVLARLNARAEVVVAELVPAVVMWNTRYFGPLAGHPLRYRRVAVREEDVAAVMRASRGVRRHPAGRRQRSGGSDAEEQRPPLRRRGNRRSGCRAAPGRGTRRMVGRYAPRLRGTPATRRLEVDEVTVRTRGRQGGARHTLWFGTRQRARAARSLWRGDELRQGDDSLGEGRVPAAGTSLGNRASLRRQRSSHSRPRTPRRGRARSAAAGVMASVVSGRLPVGAPRATMNPAASSAARTAVDAE